MDGRMELGDDEGACLRLVIYFCSIKNKLNNYDILWMVGTSLQLLQQ